MCPIFCSFPNFGLIRKIPLSLVAQLVSFAEKNVDPPSGLGKNYDKQLCTQILGVEFPFNPMSWQYSWKAWKVPYNLLNCPILGLFSFSPTCFQCRMLLPILLTSHSVWKYLKKVAFFNIQHFLLGRFFLSIATVTQPILLIASTWSFFVIRHFWIIFQTLWLAFILCWAWIFALLKLPPTWMILSVKASRDFLKL